MEIPNDKYLVVPWQQQVYNPGHYKMQIYFRSIFWFIFVSCCGPWSSSFLSINRHAICSDCIRSKVIVKRSGHQMSKHYCLYRLCYQSRSSVRYYHMQSNVHQYVISVYFGSEENVFVNQHVICSVYASFSNTVETLYNTINFCWSTHKRHSIARPKGRGMECLLWVQRTTYCVDLSIWSSIKYLL